MIQTFYIYMLILDDIVFYVGKTNNPQARHDAHKKSFGGNTELVIVDSVKCDYADKSAENLEMFYIDLFRQYGFKLKNAVGNLNYKRKPVIRIKKEKNNIERYDEIRLLRPKDVCELLNIDILQLDKMVLSGLISPPIKLSRNIKRYRYLDVKNLLIQNIQL